MLLSRKSPEVFYKIDHPKNFPKSIGDHLHAFSACNFMKKRDSGTGVFLWVLRNV